MPPLQRSPTALILGAGLLVGVLLLAVRGPGVPEPAPDRIVVDDRRVEELRVGLSEELGRQPTPGELAGMLAWQMEEELLGREAARRGRSDAPPILAHIRRAAEARRLGPPPTLSEVVAFIDLRRDAYADLIPLQLSLSPADDPVWEIVTALAEAQRRARMEMQAAERAASADQSLREVAPRIRFDLSRGARTALQGGGDATVAPPGAATAWNGLGDDLPGDMPDPLDDDTPDPRDGASPDPFPQDPFPQDPRGRAAAVFLEEIEAGSYDVVVLLPPGVDAGDMTLRRDGCELVGPRHEIPVLAGDPTWLVLRDRLRCAAPLYGEPAAEGRGPLELSAPPGVPVDLEFRLRDGSEFFALLYPGGSRLDVTLSDGAGSALVDGLEGTLRSPAAWLVGILAGFLLAALPLAGGLPPLAGALLAFGAGHTAGGWLAGSGGGPLVAPLLPTVLGLLAALMLALALARGVDRSGLLDRLGSLAITLGLLGLLFGASTSPLAALVAPSPGGWLPGEAGVLLAAMAGVGGMVGLLPASLVGVVAGWIALRADRRRTEAGARAFDSAGVEVEVGVGVGVGAVVGVAATALLVPILAWVWLAFPGGVARQAVEAGLLGLGAGLLVAVGGRRAGGNFLSAFALFLLIGLLLPLPTGGRIPIGVLTGTVVAGTLLVAGALLLRHARLDPAMRVTSTRATSMGVAIAGAVVIGLHLGGAGGGGAGGTGGGAGVLPWSSILGSAVVAVALVWVGSRLAWSWTPAVRSEAGVSAMGEALVPTGVALVLMIAAVATRLADYLGPVREELRTSLAFGHLPIPVLALLLATTALVLRPGRRRVAETLVPGRPRRSVHLWAAALAFLLLPFGTVQVALPQGAGAPAEEDARRIVAQLLSATYEAFNLEDEQALYDRLAESVTPELLPALFLDSRRRLAAGSAEEDQVDVLGVTLTPGGEVTPLAGEGGAFAWSGRWAVAARVTHLAHTHRRENLYTGRIVVRSGPDGWKLEAVELTGEERAALPWGGP